MPAVKIENDVPETPPDLPGASVTDRGFTTYTQITDTYGHKVTVRKSSAVFEDAVWVFCSNPDGGDESAHLNAEQATIVRDALNAFLAVHGAE